MPVHAHHADGVLILTLDRPERRNALDLPMWHALRDHALHVPDDVRAVIITGASPHFCSGMDLNPDNPVVARVMPAFLEGNDDAARSVIDELKECIAAVAGIEVPTFAAIEGACIGGGFEVALACDVRIAAENASIGLTETRIGMIPDLGGCVRLTRLVGPGRAADLIATGRRVSGSDAFRLGCVERVVEPGATLVIAQEAAAAVAENAPEATRLALGVVRVASDLGLDEALALETRAGVMALISGEPREGIAAFLEKRAPRWT